MSNWLRGAIAFVLFTAPAYAAPIAPSAAIASVGKIVTVEGVASIYTPGRNTMTFVDLGGSGRSAPFSGVIFAADFSTFPNVAALNGKTVDISGTIQLYQGKPEIILTSPEQLKLVQ